MSTSMQHGLTRRSFLKTAAASGVAASLAGGALSLLDAPEAAFADEAAAAETAAGAADEQIFSGVCRNFCTNACFLDCHVRDGKVVQTSARDMPNPAFNRICSKGLTIPYQIYGSHRIQTPLKRVGERGAGEFEAITWDEAIDEIATTWKQIIDESGYSAIAYHRMTGNNSFLNGSSAGGMFMRFVAAMGMTVVDGAFDTAEPLANDRMLGNGPFCANNAHGDYINSKTIVIWGANPATCQTQTMHFLTEARDNGTKLIYIDPIYNQTSAMVDQWVPLRAASDGALALGLMNVVLENGWQDEAYLLANSTAPYLVKRDDHKYLRLSDLGLAEAESEEDAPLVMTASGEAKPAAEVEAADMVLDVTEADVEGFIVDSAFALLKARCAEYPLDKVTELTGVDADTITDLADQIANNTPTAFYTAYGADHYVNGHYNYSAIIALAILTGNVGKKGAFCGTSFIRTGGMPGKFFINADGVKPTAPLGEAITVKMPRMTEVMENKTHNGSPLEVRSLFVACGNPIISNGKRQATIEWMNKLDFIVVSDIYMTDTCDYADIILPAAHWFEVEDAMSNASSHPYLLYQEKAIEPLYESKPDFEIYQLLAAAMGLEDKFEFTEQEYLELLFDTDDARNLGISYESLKEQKAIPWLAEDYVYAEDGTYKTPTGKAQFYVEAPSGSNPYKEGWDLDKEYLPYWEPPREAWAGSELREKYPFHILTEKSKYRTHTIWGNVEVMGELDPEPFVNINPADAEELGIADGDQVRVSNDRGSMVLVAHLFANVPPKTLSMTKGWQKGQFIEGHYSDLTSDEMSPFCANQPFFDVVVKIEKA